jgi:hypothetical protein
MNTLAPADRAVAARAAPVAGGRTTGAGGSGQWLTAGGSPLASAPGSAGIRGGSRQFSARRQYCKGVEDGSTVCANINDNGPS